MREGGSLIEGGGRGKTGGEGGRELEGWEEGRETLLLLKVQKINISGSKSIQNTLKIVTSNSIWVL